MTDPIRWREDDGASPEIRELFANAPPAPELSGDARKRVAAFAATIAATNAVAATGSAFATLKVIGALIALSIGGAAIVALSVGSEPEQRAPRTIERPAPVEREVSPASIEPVAAPEEPEVEIAPAPPVIVRPRAQRHVAPIAEPVVAEPAPDTLPLEAALLERARGSLGSDPSQALALADEHARTFSSGQLASEREIIAVDALLRLGRRAEAEARADSLIARAPRGMYARRLMRMLGRSEAQ